MARFEPGAGAKELRLGPTNRKQEIHVHLQGQDIIQS
jgi:hypothetical protein